ncbi:MAG: hypothetical protein K2X27_24300 [Candidatus Obscuribacterales bacterium]|nr:hypothetical protein [Candidatus Obscuribacterales bacterium]
MRTFVSAIGSGLGDLLISLPVIQKLIESEREVYLLTRSHRQSGIGKRIKGLKGELPEKEFQAAKGDRYINLRAHPLQTDHIWGSKEFESFFGPSNIEKIIKAIAADEGIEIDYSQLEPLEHNLIPDLKNSIAFVPGSDGFYKHWPDERWLKLAQLLGKSYPELKIVLLGKANESPSVQRLIALGFEWLKTKDLAAAIDAISSCRAVVSVDTGLMHAAVQQGIPTYTFIHPQNFHQRSAKHCFNFFARNCPESCRRDFSLKDGFRAASELSVDLKFEDRECILSANENCMGSITAESVFEKMKSTQ